MLLFFPPWTPETLSSFTDLPTKESLSRLLGYKATFNYNNPPILPHPCHSAPAGNHKHIQGCPHAHPKGLLTGQQPSTLRGLSLPTWLRALTWGRLRTEDPASGQALRWMRSKHSRRKMQRPPQEEKWVSPADPGEAYSL